MKINTQTIFIQRKNEQKINPRHRSTNNRPSTLKTKSKIETLIAKKKTCRGNMIMMMSLESEENLLLARHFP